MLIVNRPVWRQIIFTFIILVSLSVQTAFSKDSIVIDNLSSLQIARDIASVPLAFTENQGQRDKQDMFRVNVGGATTWFADNGFYNN